VSKIVFACACLYTRNAKPHANCWKRSSLLAAVLPAQHLAWNRCRHCGIHPARICASRLRKVLHLQQLQSVPVEIYPLSPDAVRLSASGMLRAEYLLP
jgi:hypothetical protein